MTVIRDKPAFGTFRTGRSRKVVRVLVVDDSALMRRRIRDALEKHADMVVVGEAADGLEALDLIEQQRPDVVTLDLRMPRLDGLATLDEILVRRPTPVIVCSALTQATAEATWQALDRGAMDYVAKPEDSAQARTVLEEELPQKIRNMAGADIELVLKYRRLRQARRAQPHLPSKTSEIGTPTPAELADRCIAIGASTGGPPALARLFGTLARPLPPIVIVQHMPAKFTGPFAERLHSLSNLEVREGRDGDVLRPNLVLMAPGGLHLRVRRHGAEVRAAVYDAEPVSGHKPSVDVLMCSVAECFGRETLGVIMTGMGRDGADGCAAIRAAGGYVLGQDETSSDVYGMNKAAFVDGHVDRQVSLAHLGEAIERHSRRLPPR